MKTLSTKKQVGLTEIFFLLFFGVQGQKYSQTASDCNTAVGSSAMMKLQYVLVVAGRLKERFDVWCRHIADKKFKLTMHSGRDHTRLGRALDVVISNLSSAFQWLDRGLTQLNKLRLCGQDESFKQTTFSTPMESCLRDCVPSLVVCLHSFLV